MTKMRSLSVSRNPLERLQEMEAEMNPVAASAPSIEVNPAKRLPPDVARTHAPIHARTNARTNARASEPEGAETTALAQLLSTPLEAEASKGPFHAATVRMPTEVWKRVSWVASFTGRTKQEVIGEALILYLEQMRKNPPS
jgi:hypothetical protein